MNQNGMTREFSICLLPDPEITQAVENIRKSLPPSPHRDDTPHVTLLRTIRCPSEMNDEDLIRDMERLLELSKNIGLTATVRKPHNIYSPLFGVSSQVQLQASPEMKAYRKHVMNSLKANNYAIGVFERIAFLPHMSIRLGVPYTKQARLLTEQSFTVGTQLTFNKWIILRDIKKDGKYLVTQITLPD